MGLINVWPYFSLIISCVGLLWVSVLARRPFLDQRVASDLNREANWAIPNLRDRQVANAHEEAGLHHDYGRWHRNVADKIAPYQRRFPAAHAEFMTLAVHFPPGPLPKSFIGLSISAFLPKAATSSASNIRCCAGTGNF